MLGLVEQLQMDATDESVPVTTLLRKVKMVAVKLGLDDALDWVRKELEGYDGEVPDYREGRGHTIAMDNFGRWIPFVISDPGLADTVATVYFLEPVSNYEDLLASGKGPFRMPTPREAEQALISTFGLSANQIANNIPRSYLVRIVQQVRNLVLDWALELARTGINGDGLTFSEEEREVVKDAHITIGSFQGTFNTGDAGGNITQKASHLNWSLSDQTLFDDIERTIREKIGKYHPS